MEFWDAYMYGEFHATLKKIAEMEDEGNEWDAVDKYSEVRELAKKALSRFNNRPETVNVPVYAQGVGGNEGLS